MPAHIVVRDPHIQGTPRSAISIENSRSFNSYFSKNTRLPSFIYVSVGNFSPVQEISIGKSLVLFLPSES